MKLIIASLIVFSLVIVFLFALFPSEISVSRVIRIKASTARVKKKVADLREWKNWNGFLYGGLAGAGMDNVPEINDSLEMQSQRVTIRVLKVLPDTVVTRWQNGRKSFDGNFILKDDNGWTLLEWTLQFHIKWYPWEKLASMFYEKQLGPVMEKSLQNLQKELEADTRQPVSKL